MIVLAYEGTIEQRTMSFAEYTQHTENTTYIIYLLYHIYLV